MFNSTILYKKTHINNFKTIGKTIKFTYSLYFIAYKFKYLFSIIIFIMIL
jgi:hypothetical protein